MDHPDRDVEDYVVCVVEAWKEGKIRDVCHIGDSTETRPREVNEVWLATCVGRVEME